MHTGVNAIDDYAAAVASERQAWEAVRHHLPGSAGFSQELWRQWRLAVDAADQAAARAKRSISLAPATAAGTTVLGTPRPQPVQLPPIFSRLRLHRQRP